MTANANAATAAAVNATAATGSAATGSAAADSAAAVASSADAAAVATGSPAPAAAGSAAADSAAAPTGSPAPTAATAAAGSAAASPAAAGSAAPTNGSTTATSSATTATTEPPPIPSGSTILFIGDSITDCHRDRQDPDSLGDGFAALAAAGFAAANPRTPVRFLNRGIGGDRAVDLRGRWRRDCLDLEPDVVSIMIGINEVWRRYDRADPTSSPAFEADYRDVLERTAKLGARLIMMEPFLLPVDDAQRTWREDLDEKLTVVRALAEDFGATLIPTDRLMTDAAESAGGPDVLAADGVHPTPAGHAVLANAWLAAL